MKTNKILPHLSHSVLTWGWPIWLVLLYVKFFLFADIINKRYFITGHRNCTPEPLSSSRRETLMFPMDSIETSPEQTKDYRSVFDPAKTRSVERNPSFHLRETNVNIYSTCIRETLTKLIRLGFSTEAFSNWRHWISCTYFGKIFFGGCSRTFSL